jgi:MscS family membrane protein
MHFIRINLDFSQDVSKFFTYFNSLALTLAITLLILTIISYLFTELHRKLLQNSKTSLAATIPLLSKIIKSLIVICGALYALKTLGFNINAIIAALGVGGLAIALASQKTVENLFGGVVLAMDQPIRVGDVGKFGSFVGVVKDLGLRSTTIQTPSRTIITIPNASLSSDIIENLSFKDKTAFTQNIIIKYETPSVQLVEALKQIDNLMLKNNKIEKETARAKIIKFEPSGINLEVFAYILTTDLIEFLSIQQDMILQIMEIVQKQTSGFAVNPLNLK